MGLFLTDGKSLHQPSLVCLGQKHVIVRVAFLPWSPSSSHFLACADLFLFPECVLWFLCVCEWEITVDKSKIVWGGMKPCEEAVNACLTRSFCLLTLIIIQFILVCISKGSSCRKRCFCGRNICGYRWSRACLKQRHDWFCENKTLLRFRFRTPQHR